MSGFNVDISEIKTQTGGVLPVDLNGNVCAEDYAAKVSVYGSVLNEHGLFRFEGRIEGVVSTCCARCLEKVELPYDAEIQFSFSNVNADLDETFFFSGNVVDFEDAICGSIKADMPIAVLCFDECKGLCQVCGHNLNEGDCGCERVLLNPVLNKFDFMVDENNI